MSKEDAQKAAKDALRAMRFGQNGYLFIVDSKPQVILNPGLPQTEGNMVGEFKDPDGVYVYRAILEGARRTTGEDAGFSTYRGRLPGTENPQRKLTYGRYVADWDWFVCHRRVPDRYRGRLPRQPDQRVPEHVADRRADCRRDGHDHAYRQAQPGRRAGLRRGSRDASPAAT
jgi:hypothetical protein